MSRNLELGCGYTQSLRPWTTRRDDVLDLGNLVKIGKDQLLSCSSCLLNRRRVVWQYHKLTVLNLHVTNDR